MTWGPFTVGIGPAERMARLRSLRAMALLMCRRQRDFIAILKAAEMTNDGALRKEERAFELMPALTRRHLLASYCMFGGAA
jgi:hypothetical protein